MQIYKDKKQYRYKDYDYSQAGVYFVTICTNDRELFFGDVADCKMILSGMGKIAERFWIEIPNHFPFVSLDEFIVMPNHVHGIIQIMDEEERFGEFSRGTEQCSVRTSLEKGGSKFGKVTPKSLSTIIGSYKSIVTKTINLEIKNPRFKWHTRFFDRIIRNEDEYINTRQYIVNNPDKWELEKNNSENLFM